MNVNVTYVDKNSDRYVRRMVFHFEGQGDYIALNVLEGYNGL
jgi:hypothetical protein